MATASSPHRTINFANVAYRDVRDTVIYLRAAGKTPLVIQKVDIKCVCTKVDWPRTPIMPGDSAAVRITFRAQEKGVFYKTILITTSQSTLPTEVIVRGNVK